MNSVIGVHRSANKSNFKATSSNLSFPSGGTAVKKHYSPLIILGHEPIQKTNELQFVIWITKIY
jgi:hypothetical protein